MDLFKLLCFRPFSNSDTLLHISFSGRRHLLVNFEDYSEDDLRKQDSLLGKSRLNRGSNIMNIGSNL